MRTLFLLWMVAAGAQENPTETSLEKTNEQAAVAIKSIEAPYIESIASGDSIEMEGKLLKVGDPIVFKALLKTHSEQSIRIGLEDGSSVTIGSDTDVKFDDQTSVIELIKGALFGKVEKALGAGPHKMIIQAKTAVVGVRGTEFAVETGDGPWDAEVHTLAGFVDVAKSRSDLDEGRGSQLGANQKLVAASVGGWEAKPFERKKFLKDWKARHPRLELLRAKRILRRQQILERRKAVKEKAKERIENIQDRRKEQLERRKQKLEQRRERRQRK